MKTAVVGLGYVGLPLSIQFALMRERIGTRCRSKESRAAQ